MFSWFKRRKTPRKPSPYDNVEIDLGGVFQDTSPVVNPLPPGLGDYESPHEDMYRHISVLAAMQARQEILAQIEFSPRKYSEREQMQMMLTRGRQLCDLHLEHYFARIERDRSDREIRQELAELKSLVSAIPNKTSVDQLTDFWHRHPFMVGFLGADVVHKMKKQFG